MKRRFERLFSRALGDRSEHCNGQIMSIDLSGRELYVDPLLDGKKVSTWVQEIMDSQKGAHYLREVESKYHLSV